MTQEKYSLTSVEQLMEQGRTHLINANAQAIDCFKRVVELQKDHQEAHTCLVLCCLRFYGIMGKEDDEDASHLFNTHSEQITDEAILALITLLVDNFRIMDSIPHMNDQLAKLTGMKIEEDLKQENPVDVKLLLKLGILFGKACLHIEVHQPDKALAILEKIKSHYPHVFGKQQHQLIDKSQIAILVEQKCWHDALARLKKLIQQGHYLEMIIDIIDAFKDMLKVPEALSIIEQEFFPALKTDNNPAFSLFWFCYVQYSRRRAATEYAEGKMDAYNLLYQKTLPILEQAIAIYPECFKFYTLKAHLVRNKDNLTEIELLYSQAIRLSGNIFQPQYDKYMPDRFRELLSDCHYLRLELNKDKGSTQQNLYDEACYWFIEKGNKPEPPPQHLQEMIDKVRHINELRAQRQRVWESATKPWQRLSCNKLTQQINQQFQALGLLEYQEPLLQLPSLLRLSIFTIKQHNLSTGTLCDDAKAKISGFDEIAMYRA